MSDAAWLRVWVLVAADPWMWQFRLAKAGIHTSDPWRMVRFADVWMREQLPPEDETPPAFAYSEDWDDYKRGTRLADLLDRNRRKRAQRESQAKSGKPSASKTPPIIANLDQQKAAAERAATFDVGGWLSSVSPREQP